MLDHFINLIDNAGLGQSGKTLFKHQMPAECERGILLRFPLEGVKYDMELPGYHDFDLEVIVRAKEISDGEMFAEQVVDVLKTNRRRTFNNLATGLPELLVNFMAPRTLPIGFPRLEGNGREWSVAMHTNVVRL